MTSERAKRRRIASGSAVRWRMAAAYLTISSYWRAIRSQSIGAPRIGSRLGSARRRPGSGSASFWRAIAFSRGASSKPSRWQNANPTTLWPWLFHRPRVR